MNFSFPIEGTPDLDAMKSGIQVFLPTVQSVTRTNGRVHIEVPGPLTSTEASALVDYMVNFFAQTLIDLQNHFVNTIDVETNRRIEDEGFEFPPGSGKRFGSTIYAQTEWLGAYAFKDHSQFTYPVEVRTIDDAENISLADAAAVEGYVLTLLGTVRYKLNAGRTAKQSVLDATTRADVVVAAMAYLNPS